MVGGKGHQVTHKYNAVEVMTTSDVQKKVRSLNP